MNRPTLAARCIRRGRFLRLVCELIIVFAYAVPAAAHDARPLSLNISQQSKNFYIAHIRIPPTVPTANQPRITWPAGCSVINDNVRALPTEGRETTSIRCKTGLEGRHIKVAYPVYNPSLPTLFRLHEVGGRVITRVQPPDRLDWKVPGTPGWQAVAISYLKLGIRHIWTGIDHLLFVTGLLVLAGTMRRVVLAITGFTIAHSITLSLSVLNLVVLPTAPVEAAIALSILFLARELARPFPDGIAGRYPIVVASSFGLLHGFGFAAALREIGLPAKELAVGLLCFNLGVEVGQICFIAIVVATILILRRFVEQGRVKTLVPALHGRMELLCGYGIGIPAAFWFIQRASLF